MRLVGRNTLCSYGKRGRLRILGGKAFSMLWLAGMLLSSAETAFGIVFTGTEDPEHNTSPPIDEINGRGWHYLGEWGLFTGTVIGPKHFITARHVGGAIGDRFRFRGKSYVTTAFYILGRADIRVWEICGTFPEPYAPLYRKSDELGKELVVFGRGTTRGEEVWLLTDRGREMRGWMNGKGDGRLRWGINEVTLILDVADLNPEVEANEIVYMIVDFDRDGGFNEAHLTRGDSGGGVFIHDGEQWALAGINFSVEGPFSKSGEIDDKGFQASIFDARDFYYWTGDETGWVLVEDRGDGRAIPSAFYAGRVSAYVDEIERILSGKTVPHMREPWLHAASRPEGPYRPVLDWKVEQRFENGGREIRIALEPEQQYFRLVGCEAYEPTAVRIEPGAPGENAQGELLKPIVIEFEPR